MKRSMSFKKWLVACFCSSLLLILAACVLVYAVDPFCRFRFREGMFLLEERYVFPGLVKNYDYDALMVGSSMTQNFDVKEFEELHGVNLLRVGIGGIGPVEDKYYLRFAEQIGKAQRYFVCIDPLTFGREMPLRTEEYLFDFNLVSHLRYFVNYDAVVRSIPKQFLIDAKTLLGLPIQEENQKHMNVDTLGRWADNSTFGEAQVLANYLEGKFATTKLDPDGLEERLRANIDRFFEGEIDWSKCTLFFPPYSVLFWYQMTQEAVFDEHLAARIYFVQQAEKFGCVVYDFQTLDCTMDLNNYKDTTHYSPEINDLIAQLLLDESYIATEESVSMANQVLIENVNTFKTDFPELEAQVRSSAAKSS